MIGRGRLFEARRRGAGVCVAALAAAGLTWAAPAQAATGYDLVVTDVRPVLVGTQATGSEVVFQATIKNTGNRATPARTVHGVAFTVDGRTVTWNDRSTASLAAGASRTLTASGGTAGKATWTAGSGTFTLGAIVDDVNRLKAETNERNNSRTTPLAATQIKPVTEVRAVTAITQDDYERDVWWNDVGLTWKIPQGQPVGVTYAVEEVPTGLCDYMDEPFIDRGTTTGSSMKIRMDYRDWCGGRNWSARDAVFQVTTVAPRGGGSWNAEPSNSCRSESAYTTTNSSDHNYWWYKFGCSGSTYVYTIMQDTALVVDAGSVSDTGFTGGQSFTASFPELRPAETTSRWGWSKYTLPVRDSASGGDWNVRLTFVEPTFTAKGKRVFDVRVNGVLVASRLDIFAQVGRGKAYVLKAVVPVNPANPDIVEIIPTSYADNPIIAAIQVTPW